MTRPALPHETGVPPNAMSALWSEKTHTRHREKIILKRPFAASIVAAVVGALVLASCSSNALTPTDTLPTAGSRDETSTTVARPESGAAVQAAGACPSGPLKIGETSRGSLGLGVEGFTVGDFPIIGRECFDYLDTLSFDEPGQQFVLEHFCDTLSVEKDFARIIGHGNLYVVNRSDSEFNNETAALLSGHCSYGKQDFDPDLTESTEGGIPVSQSVDIAWNSSIYANFDSYQDLLDDAERFGGVVTEYPGVGYRAAQVEWSPTQITFVAESPKNDVFDVVAKYSINLAETDTKRVDDLVDLAPEILEGIFERGSALVEDYRNGASWKIYTKLSELG